MEFILEMPKPYGGRLVEAVSNNKEECSGCPSIEIRSTVDATTGIPIRNAYKEVMSIAYGFFSPLDRFMTRNDVESVIAERRLPEGWIFPLPIVYDVTDEEIREKALKEGNRVQLNLKGHPFAYIDIEEIWNLDAKDLANRAFGTPEKNGEVLRKALDQKHPGWQIYRNMKNRAIAGRVKIIDEPKFRDPYNRFWITPAESRRIFKEKNWRTVIAHQTRNVPHRGHEELMKEASFCGDVEPCNAILVNAIIGSKRMGDFVDEAILEGHEALEKYGYISQKRHMVSFTLWDMRYGSPLESLLHGIIRQNMGCTHHMFGRDHASVGDYFDPYATQKLWTKGLPSYGFPDSPLNVDKGLSIRPVNVGEFVYCPVCGGMVYADTCSHKEAEKLSGSFIRGIIAEGITPPDAIFRREVYEVILKWWAKYDYPFVNKRYLQKKEEELEVYF